MMRIAGHKLSSSTQYSKDKLIYNLISLDAQKNRTNGSGIKYHWYINLLNRHTKLKPQKQNISPKTSFVLNLNQKIKQKSEGKDSFKEDS